MSKRLAFICMLFAAVLLCASCGQSMQNTAVNTDFDNESVIAESTEAVVVKSTATDCAEPVGEETEQPDDDFEFPFSSIDELDADADFVFAGVCVAVEPRFQNDTIYTLSQVKVEQVFRGDVSIGDIICFVEYGGRVTNGEYNEGCNLGPIPESAQETIDEQVVVGIDGYYPFMQGDKALLFACDVSGFINDFDEPLYNATGGYYGKLLLQEVGSYARPPSETDRDIYKDSLVITIDELKQYYKK